MPHWHQLLVVTCDYAEPHSCRVGKSAQPAFCFLLFSTILPSPCQPCCCSNGARLSLPNYATFTMDRESGATEEARISRNVWFHLRRHRYCYPSDLHTRIRALMIFAFKHNHILAKLALNASRLESAVLQLATGAVVHQ